METRGWGDGEMGGGMMKRVGDGETGERGMRREEMGRMSKAKTGRSA
jgi:hypothetical protein